MEGLEPSNHYSEGRRQEMVCLLLEPENEYETKA